MRSTPLIRAPEAGDNGATWISRTSCMVSFRDFIVFPILPGLRQTATNAHGADLPHQGSIATGSEKPVNSGEIARAAAPAEHLAQKPPLPRPTEPAILSAREKHASEGEPVKPSPVAVAPSSLGGSTSYSDRYKYLWGLALISPLIPLLGAYLEAKTGLGAFTWVSIVLWFGLIPIADWIIGPDGGNNPPETAVPQLEQDPFYRYLTYCAVPIHYGVFLACVWYVGTHQLDWFGLIGLTLALGLVNGNAINVGHELGHKNSVLEHWLAKAVLALVGYGHFYIEHNKGHHRHVATPEDPASARFGESIYQFARREIPGAWRRAWETERSRLTRKGKNCWSWENQILQPLGLTLLLYGILVAVFGVIIVPFLIAQAAIGWLQLTLANYIEHYGLLRLKMPDGRYERWRPEHSWNSNHLISNFVLLHLQRHSDHHANPMRRYQSLRNFRGIPQLPAGYPAMYLLALVPPLWRRVMDPLLLKQVKGDMSRVNIGPRHEESRSVAGEGSGRCLPEQA